MSSDKIGTFVDVGVGDFVLIRNRTLPVNARVTVKIKRVKKTLEGYSVARDSV